jgi:hypothetical protein
MMDETIGYSELLNELDDVIENNLFDFYLFSNYSDFANYDPCLAIDEMNFYYESMKDLALEVLPSPTGDQVISQVEVGYDLLFYNLESNIFHTMIVVRSTKVEILNEEYEKAIILPCCL